MPKPKITGNLALDGFSDIFKTTVTAPLSGEQIVDIPLNELFPPEIHPFQVNDDEAMNRLTESVKKHGVREPGIVRSRDNGGYELLCGNRRKRACELAEIPVMPVIIRELDDDSAAITMIDSNLQQREKLLLSEKAWAYRVKLEALNHSGVKGDMLSVDVLVNQTGECKNKIFRLIRLTELVYTLLDRLDAKKLAFSPAVELSYLSQKEQLAVASAMDKYEIKPSLSQAQRIRKLNQSGELTAELIDKILSEVKKPPKNESGITKYRKYFPPGCSTKQMDEIITKLLSEWRKGDAV